jgi:hypothetical protein
MPEIINFGALQLTFLQSKDDTAGSLDLFEMTLQPNARMPIPHYHFSGRRSARPRSLPSNA